MNYPSARCPALKALENRRINLKQDLLRLTDYAIAVKEDWCIVEWSNRGYPVHLHDPIELEKQALVFIRCV
jgi:hypothetical protein